MTTCRSGQLSEVQGARLRLAQRLVELVGEETEELQWTVDYRRVLKGLQCLGESAPKAGVQVVVSENFRVLREGVLKR